MIRRRYATTFFVETLVIPALKRRAKIMPTLRVSGTSGDCLVLHIRCDHFMYYISVGAHDLALIYYYTRAWHRAPGRVATFEFGGRFNAGTFGVGLLPIDET